MKKSSSSALIKLGTVFHRIASLHCNHSICNENKKWSYDYDNEVLSFIDEITTATAATTDNVAATRFPM